MLFRSYQNGTLSDALTGERIKSWFVQQDSIMAEQYAVEILTKDGRKVRIEENEKEIFYDDSRFKIALSESPMYIPSFANRKFDHVLKVLLQEIILNINQDKIYANYLSKSPASYTDLALLSMILDKTGQSALLAPYLKVMVLPDITTLDPQNLGALLYLYSLKGTANQAEVGQMITYIRSKDFQKADVAIDQLKWLKFGLKKFEMEDHLNFNTAQNTAISSFWLDFLPKNKPSDQALQADLANISTATAWGREHTYRKTLAPVSNQNYPLSWQTTKDKIQSPNLAHAVEMFLALLDIAK